MILEVNIPEIVAEVEAAFARYEDALVNNRIDVRAPEYTTALSYVNAPGCGRVFDLPCSR